MNYKYNSAIGAVVLSDDVIIYDDNIIMIVYNKGRKQKQISAQMEFDKKEGVLNWGWILLFGVLIIIFAFMSIVNPLIGAGYLVFTLAFSIFLLGIANIFLALQLRKVKSAVKDITG